MQHEWMIDVLNDLRAFSYNHKLLKLAEQLDDAILIAASEMAPLDEHAGMPLTHGQGFGNHHRSAEAG
ncbi:MAG: hypothetical protein AAF429_06870 [Pseudomonadota bacterium]